MGMMDEIRDLIGLAGKEPEEKEPEDEKVESEAEKELKGSEEKEAEAEKEKAEEKEEKAPEKEKGSEESELISSLKSEIEELKSELEKLRDERVKAEQEAEKEKEPEVVEFVKSDDELEEIVSSREKFNRFLTNLVKMVREEATNGLPDATASIVEARLKAERLVDQFYQENPDLKRFRRYVGVEANRIQQEHPDWPLERILSETEKVVRENLELKKDVKDEKDEGKPAFAEQKHGSKRVEEPVKGLKAEIRELLKGV